MKYQLIFHLIAAIYAKIDSDFLIDYFQYKNAPSVVGFSCNSENEDLNLIKNFNEIGIKVALSKQNKKIEMQLNRFAHPSGKLGVFVDIRCYDLHYITLLFDKASDYRMLQEEIYCWLILGNSVSNITSILDPVALGQSSDFVVAIPGPTVSSINYELYDIYYNTDFNITFFGTWDEDNKLIVSLKNSIFQRRANFHGVILRTSFFYSKWRPKNMSLENYLQDTVTKSFGQSRFAFVILTHLSELLNFELQCKEAKQWKVGDAIGPIIQGLYDKEIDISGTPAVMNVKRTFLAKFVTQVWPFRTCFIFRSQESTNLKFTEILDPLVIEVWYLTLITFIVSNICMTCLFKCESLKSTKILIKLSDSLLINSGAVCQQGTDIRMSRASTRIGFLCVMAFSILFYNYYSASVVSARLSSSILKINDSLAELAKTKYKFSTEPMDYFQSLIMKPDWETKTFYNEKWIHVPEDERIKDPEEGIRLMQKGGLAYHTHPEISYPIINRNFDNREICQLTEVHVQQPVILTFAVNYNCTFADIIRVGLLRISEVGLSRRQLIRWTARKPQCYKNVLSASSINIYEFHKYLLILMLGIGLATIICIFEIVDSGSLKRNNSIERKKYTSSFCIFRQAFKKNDDNLI